VTTLEDLIVRLEALADMAVDFKGFNENKKEGFVEGVMTSVEVVKSVLKHEKERASLGL